MTTFGMRWISSAKLSQFIDLMSCYWTDTPEVQVPAAQHIHERVGVFWLEVLVSMQMESNGLKRCLVWVMYNRIACWSSPIGADPR